MRRPAVEPVYLLTFEDYCTGQGVGNPPIRRNIFKWRGFSGKTQNQEVLAGGRLG